MVLDGSNLFNASKRNFLNIKKAYERVAKYEVSFLKENKSIFLIDLEYCVGEMNYIGDNKSAMIPDQNEIKLFVDIIKNL